MGPEPLSRAARSQTDKDLEKIRKIQKIQQIAKAKRETLTETEKCSSFAQNLRVRFEPGQIALALPAQKGKGNGEMRIFPRLRLRKLRCLSWTNYCHKCRQCTRTKRLANHPTNQPAEGHFYRTFAWWLHPLIDIAPPAPPLAPPIN